MSFSQVWTRCYRRVLVLIFTWDSPAFLCLLLSLLWAPDSSPRTIMLACLVIQLPNLVFLCLRRPYSPSLKRVVSDSLKAALLVEANRRFLLCAADPSTAFSGWPKYVHQAVLWSYVLCSVGSVFFCLRIFRRYIALKTGRAVLLRPARNIRTQQIQHQVRAYGIPASPRTPVSGRVPSPARQEAAEALFQNLPTSPTGSPTVHAQRGTAVQRCIEHDIAILGYLGTALDVAKTSMAVYDENRELRQEQERLRARLLRTTQEHLTQMRECLDACNDKVRLVERLSYELSQENSTLRELAQVRGGLAAQAI